MILWASKIDTNAHFDGVLSSNNARKQMKENVNLKQNLALQGNFGKFSAL